MAEDISAMFLPQWLVLRCSGFLPLSFAGLPCKSSGKYPHCQHFFSTISRLLGFFWLGCQAFIVYIQAKLFLTGSGTVGKNANWILTALEVMPFTLIAVRPFVILIVMFTHHKASQRLKHKSAQFFAICFPDTQGQRLMITKWKKIAWATFVGTFLLHFSFELYSNYKYYDQMGRDLSADIGMTYPKLTMKWYFVTWALGVTVPFILSQQVYCWAILSAALLAKAIRNLHHRMKDELSGLTKDTFRYTSTQVLNEKVMAWQTLYMEVLEFCHSLEHFFSWILFVVYCCDSGALLGFTAAIINHFREEGWIEANLPLYAFSVIVYAVYGTIFAIPFFVVSEQSSALLFTVHKLSFATKHVQNEKESVQSVNLACNLKELMGNLRDNQCHFSGGGLFHYTRGFLVGTFTFAISISVLVKELAAKEQEHASLSSHLGKTPNEEGILRHNLTTLYLNYSSL